MPTLVRALGASGGQIVTMMPTTEFYSANLLLNHCLFNTHQSQTPAFCMQGYLTYKKIQTPRTLPWAYV